MKVKNVGLKKFFPYLCRGNFIASPNAYSNVFAMFEERYEPYIAAILDSPMAPEISAQLQTALALEQQRRQAFYRDIDDDMKAEFINGEVIVHSPVKKEHTDAVGFLFGLLNPFVLLAKLGYVGYEKVMSAFQRNDYEPDVVFFDEEKAQHFKKGQWKYPVPDFVVEVLSEGTEHRDRGVKFQDYEAQGVQEYWIIDAEEETVEQYIVKNGKFHLHLKAGQGPIESRVVKGFRIDIRAIFDKDAHLAALREFMRGGS